MVVPHLICFGDSLTAGYQSSGLGGEVCADIPYGEFLQSWLGSRGTVTVTGICGEVTQDMMGRFYRDVECHHPQAVVILGGTNDLGCGLLPPLIMKNLQHLYGQAQAAGIQAVGVTVPSICVSDETLMMPTEVSGLVTRGIPQWVQSHIKSRRALNGMIQDTCNTMQMACVDLFSGTSEGADGLLASVYSHDGLHLSRVGYERFAELVWHVLFEKSFGLHT